ncbi:MAG TPA: hypothetical protein VF173_08730 [Thermoanaerobaculia bacterium]|nr:hypothetical protein [Thermoanaerobaculia bacterium]
MHPDFPYPPLQAVAAYASPQPSEELRRLHVFADRSGLLVTLEAELAKVQDAVPGQLLDSVPKALLSAASLLAHHAASFLPVPQTLTTAYHLYLSHLETRVLQNVHRVWPPAHPLARAARHLDPLRGFLLHPAAHLDTLRETRNALADLGVYLCFARFLATGAEPFGDETAPDLLAQSGSR